MPLLTKPTPRALALQKSAAKNKRPRDDTDPKPTIAAGTTDDSRSSAAKNKRPRDETDPKAVIADGTTDDLRSPIGESPRKSPRKSPRLEGSPIGKSQVPAQTKKKTASSPSRADFAAVET
jgi:hypothetical protein